MGAEPLLYVSPIPIPLPISGYILAGGRSLRMGTDKSLLQLAGKPLIQHAVAKLRRVCSTVHILSSNPALLPYAPLVPDLHPGCGPIGGIEAALLHTACDWNLILPVDLPLLPTALLDQWVRSIVSRSLRARVAAYFTVFGLPQPTLLMIHRNAAPCFTLAIAAGEFKLSAAVEAAARELAPPGSSLREQLPLVLPVDEHLRFEGWQPPHPGPAWMVLTPAQRAAQPLWFTNLNTPEDFVDAKANIDALDT